MGIKILRQGMPVIGYAKLGESGGTQNGKQRPPVKFDHVELTGRERDSVGRLVPDVRLMARMLEEQPDLPTCGGCARSAHLAKTTGFEVFAKRGLPRRLRVVLPYDDLEVNLPNRLAWYRNRTAFCTGDGETAMRLEELSPIKKDGQTIPRFGAAQPHHPCGSACPEFGKRCKPHGKLRFVLAEQENVGGCYEFQTTSWNSLANLVESLEFIAGLTAGRLAWVPLYFDVSPQTVQASDGSAPASTAYIARVTFPGSPQALLEGVKQNLALRAPLMAEIRQLEARARSEEPWNESPEEIAAIEAEFIPDPNGKPSVEAIVEGVVEGEVVETAPEATPKRAAPSPTKRAAPAPAPDPEPDDEPEIDDDAPASASPAQGSLDDWMEAL